MQYKPQLDGLRTLAVAGVIGHHLWPQSWWGEGWLTRWGALGVPLFFVLSGYLITTLLLNARDAYPDSASARVGVWWRFGIRRALRLFPAYYLVIVIGLAFGVTGIVGLWPWHVTYTSNIWTAYTGNPMFAATHFWSLAVEEQFYLLWPMIILFCPVDKMGWVIGAVLAIGPLFRGWWEGPDVLLLSRVDQLGGGAMLAWLAHEQHRSVIERVVRVGRWVLPVLLAVFFVVWYLEHDRLHQMHPSFMLAVTWASVCLVWSASQGRGGRWGKLLELPVMTYLGRLSYSLYLTHPLVAPCLLSAFGRSQVKAVVGGPSAWFAVQVLLSVLVSMALYHLIELPFGKLKRYFPYVKPGSDSTERVSASITGRERSA
ncbi:MAG: acyltransferase [Polyangiales bacterium]